MAPCFSNDLMNSLMCLLFFSAEQDMDPRQAGFKPPSPSFLRRNIVVIVSLPAIACMVLGWYKLNTSKTFAGDRTKPIKLGYFGEVPVIPKDEGGGK